MFLGRTKKVNSFIKTVEVAIFISVRIFGVFEQMVHIYFSDVNSVLIRCCLFISQVRQGGFYIWFPPYMGIGHTQYCKMRDRP